MHYLVRIVVEADDAETAKKETTRVAEELVESGYHDWFNDNPKLSRWDNCWKPVALHTDEGLHEINEAFKEQLTDQYAGYHLFDLDGNPIMEPLEFADWVKDPFGYWITRLDCHE